MKYYMCLVTDEEKVLMRILKHPTSPRAHDVAWHSMGWQLDLSIGLNQSLVN